MTAIEISVLRIHAMHYFLLLIRISGMKVNAGPWSGTLAAKDSTHSTTK